jgi:hypothetical protein
VDLGEKNEILSKISKFSEFKGREFSQ